MPLCLAVPAIVVFVVFTPTQRQKEGISPPKFTKPIQKACVYGTLNLQNRFKTLVYIEVVFRFQKLQNRVESIA